MAHRSKLLKALLPRRLRATRPARSSVHVVASLLLLGGGSTAAAQQPVEPPPTTAFEVVARYPALVDSAGRAEREIARLAEVTPLAAEIEAARRRHAELATQLAGVAEQEYARPERISRIRDLALLEDQRLESLLERTLQRLQALSALRSAWLAQQRTWTAWRNLARTEPDYAAVEPEVQQALARIDSVLARVGEAVPRVLALQREIEALREATVEVDTRATAIRLGRREALLRRDEPLLFSGRYFGQLQEEPWHEWQPTAALRPGAYAAFLGEQFPMLLFHLVLAVAIALLARRVRGLTQPEGRWSGMLDHPWALGVFGSMVLLTQRITFAPPLWEVASWALLAGSGAVLAARMFAPRALRFTVFLLAAFYPLFLLAEAFRVPTPLFRLGLAGVALAGLLFFAGFLGREGRGGDGLATTWILRLGAAISAIVLLAETLGFFLLTRWLLHAIVISALVVFVVAFLLVLARGAIRTLLRLEAKGRWRFLQTTAVPLAERLVRVLQVVLVLGAVLVVLDIWELTPSPLATWRQVTALGVTVAGVHITLGRLLFAALMVYLAFVVSWLVRTFVDAEVNRRWELDRGVGDSINTLLHYLLIILGFLFALGALGVELQNFAIVAGALGVGIGFGLQNVVNNFVSGLILLFERPVRVGDTVVIGGEWGTVRKIGLRSTVVLTFDQSEMIVPNGDLVSEKVVNWTLSNPMARLIMPVGVAYGSHVERVLEVLREAATAHPAVLTEPPPTALFMQFGESSLDFELRIWVREIRLRLEVKSTVLARIDQRFREEGIEIPFPQRDLHLRSIDGEVLHAALRPGKEESSGDGTGRRSATEPPEAEAPEGYAEREP